MLAKALIVVLALLAPVAASRAAEPQGPPREPGRFREADLVELVRLEPGLKLDIRYATPDNFTGQAVYEEARAFLQRPAAEAVARVHRALAPRGYGLLIFDGYRPWRVTKRFWDVTPPAKRDFVANPAKGSKHNRGCAVDLSLYRLADGREVAMPSSYDDFSEKASPDYTGGTPEQRAHRELLRAAMEAEGFSVEPNEWWHFNCRDWSQYPLLDVPFGAIAAR
ncbi:MAG: M15 family metallopeptidase [Vicinamibacteria bacterium]